MIYILIVILLVISKQEETWKCMINTTSPKCSSVRISFYFCLIRAGPSITFIKQMTHHLEK